MIAIRHATATDIKQIHSLGRHVEEFITSDATVYFWPESVLQASVNTNTVIILVAEEGNELVGFIIVNCNKPLSKAIIENVYVIPTKRGRGIGTMLTREAVAEAKKRSHEYVSVLTPPDDRPAIKTYQKVGFVKGEVFLWLDYSEPGQFRTTDRL